MGAHSKLTPELLVVFQRFINEGYGLNRIARASKVVSDRTLQRAVMDGRLKNPRSRKAKPAMHFKGLTNNVEAVNFTPLRVEEADESLPP